MNTPILEARDLTVRRGAIQVLDVPSLSLEPGSVTALIGPNGSGKSTLVNLITGELEVNGGSFTFCGQDVTALPPYKRARLGMARSFQMIRLFGSLSVEENLLLAHHIRMRSGTLDTILGRAKAAQEEAMVRTKARELLQWFELEKFADRPATALSIGQQRMVELARGLISEPRLFLLDEPAAGLSPPNVDRLITIIRRMRDEFGMSILLVEHDMRVVRELCDQVAVLDSGEMIAQGEPETVVNDPVVVEAYIGSGWKRRAKA